MALTEKSRRPKSSSIPAGATSGRAPGRRKRSRRAGAIRRGASLDRGGAERRVENQVPTQLVAEAPGKSDAILFHDEVEIDHLIRVASQHEIADHATRRIDRIAIRFAQLARRAQEPEPRLGGRALES